MRQTPVEMVPGQPGDGDRDDDEEVERGEGADDADAVVGRAGRGSRSEWIATDATAGSARSRRRRRATMPAPRADIVRPELPTRMPGGGDEAGDGEGDDEWEDRDQVGEQEGVGRIGSPSRASTRSLAITIASGVTPTKRLPPMSRRLATSRAGWSGHSGQAPSNDGIRHSGSAAISRSAVSPVWRAMAAKNAARRARRSGRPCTCSRRRGRRRSERLGRWGAVPRCGAGSGGTWRLTPSCRSPVVGSR